jgi:hypothetical protein
MQFYLSRECVPVAINVVNREHYSKPVASYAVHWPAAVLAFLVPDLSPFELVELARAKTKFIFKFLKYIKYKLQFH